MAIQYPFHTGIEMVFVPHSKVCDEHDAPLIRFLIKTQCLCIWGGDLALHLPRYRPGRAHAVHVFELKENVQKVINQLPNIENAETVKERCQWIMKRLVRTGFELIMEQERSYTRDLYPCYIAFSRYFPNQAQQMRHALEWAVNPTENKMELIQFLDDFGAWLVTIVTETFPAPQKGAE